MRFTMTETDEGFVIRGDDGDPVTTFPEGIYNPAFLAFVQGLLAFDGAELWNESSARYVVSYGTIEDEDIVRHIGERRAAATPSR